MPIVCALPKKPPDTVRAEVRAMGEQVYVPITLTLSRVEVCVCSYTRLTMKVFVPFASC